jgi:hypothetical protein
MNETYTANNPSLRAPKMLHIRNVKPEFFAHEDVNELSLEAMVGWMGIWICSDKNGRFEWRPKALKLNIFPYRDVDFAKVLDELLEAGFIEKYEVNGQAYGWSPRWKYHQGIGTHEAARKFEYPAPPPWRNSPCDRREDTDESPETSY